ncbi:MAG: LysR family transcriptional regulator, partial [Alphaproteobacteria bacterium]|nr:LysR family transcriptional regulator [Alphaproteobacteria bacterium]
MGRRAMTGKFEQIRIFASVTDAGGFSRAGERLGMSRAAASRNIIELEERLGVRLFNRTTRQVSLTEAGRDFYRQCRRILDELEEAERAASAASAGPQGQLRIVAPVNFGLRELGPAAAAFLQNYPNISIDLSLNDRSIDPIEGG